ncbi:battenin [Paragonimus westermani]|uniref:Battenin n=1 Tax=Paragonimus westermani TaxID=34504 RepID=A0A5J4NP12_9TREM|nr:battenin [Paragonimus westermani]
MLGDNVERREEPDVFLVSMVNAFIVSRCFGLGNNFSYVIMLSAALDIIKKQEERPENPMLSEPFHHNCTKTGTAAAQSTASHLPIIISPLLVKCLGSTLLTEPVESRCPNLLAVYPLNSVFFVDSFKILFSCAMALNSFIMVSFSKSMTFSIIGILSASLSCGIGDVSFLSMTAFFNKNCVSAWSSGTGAAGLIGALVYAALTSTISPEQTLLVVTAVPILLALVYFLLLDRPNHPKFRVKCTCFSTNTQSFTRSYSSLKEEEEDGYPAVQAPAGKLTLRAYSLFLKFLSVDLFGLLIYLSLVYFFEYLINQSLVSFRAVQRTVYRRFAYFKL